MNYIAVCTPARDMVHTNYTYCMVNLVAYHTLNTTDAISLKLLQGTLIQNQRADLCLDALREGCTHILFIDSDMTFPQDMIQRLLKHDVDIVAANCARRRMPIRGVGSCATQRLAPFRLGRLGRTMLLALLLTSET